MKKNSFHAMTEAKKILGDDFWEAISDILPFLGPRVDMYRSEQELIIAAEIPGLMAPNDLSLTLNGYTLYIDGYIKRDYATDDKGFLLDERLNGPFRRKIRLPKDCQLEHLQADYWNGLLIIHIPISGKDMEGLSEKIQIHFHS